MTIEAQVKCHCGFRTGYFDKEHAVHIGNHHAENCDTPDIKIKEREKEHKNYSDNSFMNPGVTVLQVHCPYCEDPRDFECEFCGEKFFLNGPKNKHELTCMGP